MADAAPHPDVSGTSVPTTDTDEPSRKGHGNKGGVGHSFGGETIRIRLSGKQVRECGESG